MGNRRTILSLTERSVLAALKDAYPDPARRAGSVFSGGEFTFDIVWSYLEIHGADMISRTRTLLRDERVNGCAAYGYRGKISPYER